MHACMHTLAWWSWCMHRLEARDPLSTPYFLHETLVPLRTFTLDMRIDRSISGWSFLAVHRVYMHYICKQIALKGSFKCKILFTFSRRCLEIGDTKKLCVFNLGQQLIWSSIYSVASINQSINQSNCLGTPPHPNARWIWSDRSCRIRDPQGKVPGRMEVLCLQSDANWAWRRCVTC